jgi:hypothetical protein
MVENIYYKSKYIFNILLKILTNLTIYTVYSNFPNQDLHYILRKTFGLYQEI